MLIHSKDTTPTKQSSQDSIQLKFDHNQSYDRQHFICVFMERFKLKSKNSLNHKKFLEDLGHEISIRRKRSGLHVAKKIDGGFIGGADPRREGLVIQIN